MVLQTLSLLQIIGDLILFKHHSFQSILHACQTGLIWRTGLPRICLLLWSFLFLCFPFSFAFVFPFVRFFLFSFLSLGLYSPLNDSICFNQLTYTVIPYIGSLLSNSSCIDLYYKRKLTPILTHLRRRKQTWKGGEGRPLSWGEQAGTEDEVECFLVFSIYILIKFITKTFPISYYTNR